MSKCVKCGSYAFNLYKEDIDQGGLCDVHYWQYRAHRAEALAEQPAQQQEPVATVIGKFLTRKDELRTCIEPELPLGTKLYTTPPAQRKPLTDEDCTRIYNEANGITTKNPPITTERIFKAMRAAHGIKENT